MQAEVSEHAGKVERARQMEKKMCESFRKRVQATPGIVTAEEEDIKLQGFKESVNELLSAVLNTVEDNPELKGKVCTLQPSDISLIFSLSSAPVPLPIFDPRHICFSAYFSNCTSGVRRSGPGWHCSTFSPSQRQRQRAGQ